jgi:hypothetical protein
VYSEASVRWVLDQKFVAMSGLTVVVGLFGASPAHAYRDGISSPDCSGCHSDVGTQTVELLAMPDPIDPSDVVSFAVRITSSTGDVAGVNIHVDTGMLRPVSGGGLHSVGLELTHDEPIPFVSGVAEFRGEWIAPDEPGAVRFTISTVAGDGDGRRGSGDGSALDEIDRVFGCESATFYRDRDEDGHGAPDATRVACAGMPPDRYATTDDDCDDYRVTTYEGADELCNRRDDDCDELIDENIEPTVHYPDADGDGYYSRDERDSGEMIDGCPESGRWASLGGDCAPDDPDINPGAMEVCNLLDDDCDGRQDERVRPQCGIGWCRRDARSCDPEDCEPGAPQDETCNLLDDDCDGPIDEDVCPAGQECVDYECVPIGSGTEGDAGSDASTGGDGGGCSVSGSAVRAWMWIALACGVLWVRRRRIR